MFQQKRISPCFSAYLFTQIALDEITFDEILENKLKIKVLSINPPKVIDLELLEAWEASRMIDLIESFPDQCCTSPDVQFLGVKHPKYSDHVFRLCIQAVYSGYTFGLLIQAIHSGYSFRLFIQSIHSVYSFRVFIHAIHSGYSFKLFIQAIYSGYPFRLFIHTIHADDSFRNTPAGINIME